MKDYISPEEKLLKLVREQKKQNNTSEKKPNPDKDSVEVKDTKAARPSLTQKYFSYLNFKETAKVILGVSCLYLVISLIYPLVSLRKIRLPNIAQEAPGGLAITKAEEIKPFEFYLEGTKNRQLFNSIPEGQAQSDEGAVSPDLIESINLLGIISGESPQAFIEDKKTRKTYYVTKGQFVGELQVENIQEGKVTLRLKGGRSFELYL